MNRVMRPVVAVVQFDRESYPETDGCGSVLRYVPGRTWATIAVMADDGTLWAMRAQLDGERALAMMLNPPAEVEP